jgi:hypothetical protein
MRMARPFLLLTERSGAHTKVRCHYKFMQVRDVVRNGAIGKIRDQEYPTSGPSCACVV